MDSMSVEVQEDRLILINDVALRLGMSVKTMERRYKKGIIPPPEKNGKNRVYRASRIQAMIEAVTNYRGKL